MFLGELFGDIDIYLFDQLLKGRLPEGISILDAGCGEGRNLTYFRQRDYRIWAVDENRESLLRSRVRQRATLACRGLLQQARIERLPYRSHSFDCVLSSAVLHFAHHRQHFLDMLQEMWRVLKKGGIFWARLASRTALPEARPAGGGKFRLPDGSLRYLVEERELMDLSQRLDGELLDPIKTTRVQGLRSMATWCLRKR